MSDIQEPTDEQLLFPNPNTQAWNDLPNENVILKYTIMPESSDTSILQFEHMLHVLNADRPKYFLGGCIRAVEHEPTLYPVLFFQYPWSDFPEAQYNDNTIIQEMIHDFPWTIITTDLTSTLKNGNLTPLFVRDLHILMERVPEEDRHLTLFLSDTAFGRSLEDTLRKDEIFSPLFDKHSVIDSEDLEIDFKGYHFIHTK